jgi:microsomal prostaglandin-E synthase 2
MNMWLRNSLQIESHSSSLMRQLISQYIIYIYQYLLLCVSVMLLHRLSRQAFPHTARRGLHHASVRFLTSEATTTTTGNQTQTIPSPPLDITLYQYSTCPFCNRVKSYLDFMKLKYKVVEVNPMSKKELKTLNQKQVPVAVVNGDIIPDSSAILQHIHNNLAKDFLALTNINEFFLSEKSKQWSEWSEKRLAVVLYPNITRTFADSWAAFAYVSDVKDWTFMERLTNRTLGPVAMYAVRNKIKKKYGIVVSE